MKFDVVIGNPPFQEELAETSDKPIYNDFLDATYLITEKAAFITPGRFLFNAGKTPKKWNEKMLSDNHLKVCFYKQKSGEVFPNTDIKGGVAITYHDIEKNFGAIKTFTQYADLNSIIGKVVNTKNYTSLKSIIFTANRFNLKKLYEDFPKYKKIIGSNGKEKRLTTSIFEKLEIFSENKIEQDQVKIIGLANLKRIEKFINIKYLETTSNLNDYKVILPKSNGSGTFGELLSSPFIGNPGTGYTQTFISIGQFGEKNSADSMLKYIKTKFLRTMLGTLKITQDNNRETWENVPLQDFTPNSDIDWSKSIPEIDQQFYAKYGLDEKEIDFIETNVKEME